MNELEYAEMYRELVQVAKEHGIEVKLVPEKQLHDYEAMNPCAAKAMGYKAIKPNEIEIEIGLPYEKKYKDLNHELIEKHKMDAGWKYWQAHEYALKHEGEVPKVVVARIKVKHKGHEHHLLATVKRL